MIFLKKIVDKFLLTLYNVNKLSKGGNKMSVEEFINKYCDQCNFSCEKGICISSKILNCPEKDIKEERSDNNVS